MRFAGMALAACLLLAGCGGDGEKAQAKPSEKATTKAAPKAPKTSKTPKASEKTAATVAPPTGTPAPGDLSNFQCLANDKGVWNASGLLRNGTKKQATYQLTAFIGRADGKDTAALTKEVQSVNAGGSVRVGLSKIPAAKDATQCYVQVLRK